MTRLETKQVDARFTEIKALARDGKPLSEEGLQSAADVAAYDAVCEIYSDMHLRRMSKNELTARGNRVRARYIQDKRSELLNELIYKRSLEAAKRSQGSFSKLVHWKQADGDKAALLDTLQEYIHALTGEVSPVTAKVICNVLRRELTDDSEGGMRNSESEGTACGDATKKSKRFRPPTLDEVKAYFAEKRFKSDPEEFFDFYEGSGWKRGRGVQIKDWKATANNWERKEGEFRRQQEKNGGRKGSIYSSDASYDLEAYKKTAIGLYDDRPKEETA